MICGVSSIVSGGNNICHSNYNGELDMGFCFSFFAVYPCQN